MSRTSNILLHAACIRTATLDLLIGDLTTSQRQNRKTVIRRSLFGIWQPLKPSYVDTSTVAD